MKTDFTPNHQLDAGTAETGGSIAAPLLDTKTATLETCKEALLKICPYVVDVKDGAGGTDLSFANYFSTAQANGQNTWQAKFTIYDFIKAIRGEDLKIGVEGNGKESHNKFGFHLPVSCWIPGGPGELAQRINEYSASHSKGAAK